MNTVVSFIFLTVVFAQQKPLTQPCYGSRCLPNAILLGAGIDLSTGNPAKGLVLDLQWCNDTYYINPNNGEYYNIPCGVSVNPLSESSDTEGTFMFDNVESIEQWQMDQVTKSGLAGMFSHSEMTYQSMTSEYEQIRNTAYVIKKMAVYNTIIPASQQKLNPECQKNVDMLPPQFNTSTQNQFYQFIDTYGTDYSDTAYWGISYTFLSNYKQCMVSTHSESYVYSQTTTNAWIASDHHTSYSGQSSTDSYYQSRTITSESFDGGDMACHSSAMWDCWWLSGMNMDNPVRISYQTRRIYELIEDPDRQDAMRQAYNKYYMDKKAEQDLIVQQKKLGPHSVTYGVYSYALDVYKTPYITTVIPSTQTVLSSNTIMPPVGSRDCNFYQYVDARSKNGVHLEYYYDLNLYACRRDTDGNIVAEYAFDENVWLNTVVPASSNCRYITTNFTKDCVRKQYYWTQVDANNFKGASKTSTVTGYNGYCADNIYGVNYYDRSGNINTKRTSYNGYPGNDSVKYSETSGFFTTQNRLICMLDCDYMTVSYQVDGNGMGYLQPTCAC